MSMAVTLVSGAYPDNRQHAGIYTDAAAQTSYFDSLDKLTRECKTVPLGDDIYFSGTIEELRGRSYGWIDYGDGFRYYFSIYDFDFVSTETTRILYKVDIYETYLFHGLRFGRAALERAPLDIGRPMMAIGYDYYDVLGIDNTEFRYGVVALGGWSSSGDELLATLSNFYQDETQNFNYHLLFTNGQGQSSLWSYKDDDWVHTPSDLKHAAVYPDSTLFLSQPEGDYVHRVKWDTPESNGQQMVTNKRFSPYSGGGIAGTLSYRRDYALPLTVSSRRTGWSEVRDMRGNTIFKPNYGEVWQITGVLHQVNMSGSCMLLDMFKTDTYEHMWLPMPGESLDSMTDTWQEYNYRQRETDMQMRSLSNQRQLVQSFGNVGSSAIGGAIGAQMGGLSGGLGQAAGAISQIVGSVANYAMNEGVFDPKEQQIIDAQMQKAADSVNFFGASAATPTLFDSGPQYQGVWTCRMNTHELIEQDISINGYPVDFRGNMPQLSEGAWKGQVEVLDLPGAWRDQVMQRFAGGVVIGRLG